MARDHHQADVWIETARGGYRLCGTGRMPGTTWRSAHLCVTREEALTDLRTAEALAHPAMAGGGR